MSLLVRLRINHKSNILAKPQAKLLPDTYVIQNAFLNCIEAFFYYKYYNGTGLTLP